jgi:pimeloyl-ACP methyl ester carboxylesterase
VIRALLVVASFVAAVAALPFVGDALFGWRPDARVLPEAGTSIGIGGGRSLNVRDGGAGDVVVLVHGWASSAIDWDSLPERLRALGHRVVAYDRAGYGYSTRSIPPDGGYTYASHARDLIALLDALSIERATLVGWSFGGGVVQEAAVATPDRVAALALVASVGPDEAADDDPSWLDRVLASPTVAPWVLAWVARIPPLSWETTHRRVVESFSGEAFVPTGWTIRTQAMLSLPGTFRTLASESAYADSRALRPERIRAPTLVLHGEEDAVVPLAVGRGLARRIPDASLEVIRAGSHMLPVTHAERLAGAIHALTAETPAEEAAPPTDGAAER